MSQVFFFFYIHYSNLLNLVFSYLILNKTILKRQKNRLLLLLMVVLTGIMPSLYSFVSELFFFFFLFLLTVLTQKERNVYLSTIIVLTPFLISHILALANSKFVDYLLDAHLSIPIALTLSEIILYLAIYIISLLVKKWLIPRVQFNNNEKSIAISFVITYVLWLIYKIYVFYWGDDRLNVLSIVTLLAFSILIYFYIQSTFTSQKLTLEVEKQKLEVKYMNEYAKETTNQYNELRKFRHDYVNILSSLDYFIQLNDMEQLATYYKDTIQPTQESLDIGTFSIQELMNIQSDEVKSILAVKLLSAKQNEISVQIEVPDIIPKKLPVDSIVLIRVLGIILDNSIEEVLYLGEGKLEVGLFDRGDEYLFIIKNSIRDTIQPLHILAVKGYSTKGENRGLGLANLAELSQREKNLTIETEVTAEAFIQKIILSKGVD
ncbi:sensor histidine kinase [Enterococcus sp. AZ194]|uniref:sensor histidine kinase n=1 Tax=Enterococcus sp. AZ194 TaxID=2774629 RepID=UPI003F6839F2